MKTVTVRGLVLGEGRPKICASLAAPGTEEILSDAVTAVSSGADIIEWRMDLFKDYAWQETARRILPLLRRSIGNTPLLATFRTAAQGGGQAVSEADYRTIMETLLRSPHVDMIDMEISWDADMLKGLVEKAHMAHMAVILSSHDFTGTPPRQELLQCWTSMQNMGADICKIAVTPQNREDVLTLIDASLAMSKQAQAPLVAIAMGELGRITRLGADFTGSAITFGCIGTPAAPGQLSVKKLAGLYK